MRGKVRNWASFETPNGNPIFKMQSQHDPNFTPEQRATVAKADGAPGDGGAWTTSEDNGDRRVLRGGSYHDIAKWARSAARYSLTTRDWDSYASFQIKDVGFRVARSLDQ